VRVAEDGEKPFLITPPPGLIPPDLRKDRSAPPADLDSGTRKITASPTGPTSKTPAFFAAPIGAAPIGAAPIGAVPTGVAPTGAAPITAPPTAPSAEDAVPGTELVLPDGGRHSLESTLLVGRNPAQGVGWESAGLLAVIDPAKSVSKTHAAFEVSDGVVRVHDLNSTNGVTVLRQGDEPIIVNPTAPVALIAGDQILLGDYRVLFS